MMAASSFCWMQRSPKPSRLPATIAVVASAAAATRSMA
jgi:hypothetical protein